MQSAFTEASRSVSSNLEYCWTAQFCHRRQIGIQRHHGQYIQRCLRPSRNDPYVLSTRELARAPLLQRRRRQAENERQQVHLQHAARDTGSGALRMHLAKADNASATHAMPHERAAAPEDRCTLVQDPKPYGLTVQYCEDLRADSVQTPRDHAP